MDSYHRQPNRKEQTHGRDCQFCARLDPNFTKRAPIDRWVQGSLEDSATAHLSENGHIFHLLSEIAKKRTPGVGGSASLAKSA